MLAGIYFLMILSKIVSLLILIVQDIFLKKSMNQVKMCNNWLADQQQGFQKQEISKLRFLKRMKQVQFDSIDTVQINNYLKTRVLPILQPLQMQILQKRPSNVKNFAYNWLQKFKQNQDKNKQVNECDDEEPQEVFKQKIRRKKEKEQQGRSGFRVGVSGESTASLYQQKPAIVQDNKMTFERTEQTRIKILIELRNSILFKNMSHTSLLKIIQRMKPLQFTTGDVVIREGDDGNELFIVDEGFFKCMVSGKKGHEKIYGPGQAFGELALLYNTKRASTIIAQTEGRLYSLDRKEFNLILRQNVLKKTEMCDKILNNIEIFQTLDRYEKSKVYQALQQIQVQAGKYIIREGQLGDCFYIVAEGKLVAEKIQDNEVKPVYYYKEGDYFGELAILKNTMRQASVKALTKVRLLYIERSSFKRILGSIENILRRNETRYKNSPKRTKKRKTSFDRQNELGNS